MLALLISTNVCVFEAILWWFKSKKPRGTNLGPGFPISRCANREAKGMGGLGAELGVSPMATVVFSVNSPF